MHDPCWTGKALFAVLHFRKLAHCAVVLSLVGLPDELATWTSTAVTATMGTGLVRCVKAQWGNNVVAASTSGCCWLGLWGGQLRRVVRC